MKYQGILYRRIKDIEMAIDHHFKFIMPAIKNSIKMRYLEQLRIKKEMGEEVTM